MIELIQKVNRLKRDLNKLRPEHDYPIGILHPYWARKPFNIIRSIIENTTEPGDVVIDPFMGSGTTVFAALSSGRSIIGSDLNPLSTFMVKNLLRLSKARHTNMSNLKNLIDKLENIALPWYCLNGGDLYVERERFSVEGSFDNGNFRLIPKEVIISEKQVDGSFKRRYTSNLDTNMRVRNFQKGLLSNPLNFKNLKLTPNSRIALPIGANLSHFYTNQNTATINLVLKMTQKNNIDSIAKHLLLFILSASLPLLRLSDAKASSQWPYWRPKQRLTSRNPVFIFNKRYQALLEAKEWMNNNITKYDIVPIRHFPKQRNITVSILTTAIQTLQGYIHKQSADLVLTDPPYSDQAPYLEYSMLWLNILGLKLNPKSLESEIVESNSPSRSGNIGNYINNLTDGLKACIRLIKNTGIIVWFYQDRNPQHWAALHRTAHSLGFTILDIIPLKKQRRSMKTVTSPGKTLDGDLMVIFCKKDMARQKISDLSITPAERIRKILANMSDNSTLFERYSIVLKKALLEGWIQKLANEHKDLISLLR